MWRRKAMWGDEVTIEIVERGKEKVDI